MAYEPMNVQFGQVSDGCFSKTDYDVIYYPMKGKKNPSWEIIPDNGGKFIVEFKATGNGNTYRHTSWPFFKVVKQVLEKSSKRYTGNYYEVRIEQRHDLVSYFRKE